MTELAIQIATWALGNDTGMSSIEIARATLNLPSQQNHMHPLDCGDLGRCLRLIDSVPNARIGVTRLALKDPAWKKLNNQWRKLTSMAKAEGLIDAYRWQMLYRAYPQTQALLRECLSRT